MIKKISLTLFILLAFLTVTKTALAQNDKSFKIPSNAKQVSENVYWLGDSLDKQSNKVVEGYAIVHKRKDKQAKPENAGAKNGSPKQNACYTYLASGAKWKTVEPWVINPSNNHGLNVNNIFSVFSQSIDKWENAAGFNILGVGSTTPLQLEADEVSTDGNNEVYFGSIDDSNSIAVTIVWGIFGGPPAGRQLVEWDQIYDQNKFTWSLTGELTKMDWENIATHELGHSVGLGDLYTSSCTAETMYGYASEGETSKRDLYNGDITGIQNLY